ncbi:MAG: GntR family transcriptional regulator [Clostridiales bacterium]|nr:GntR family transcriptional regulator [Clostridiales bacterium]
MKNNTKNKKTLVDKVYDQIRKDIVMRKLLPNEKINMTELSKRYKVSETPVRLALNRLISENLIEYYPQIGMRVKSLSVETAMDTFNLRLMMELYFIEDIIQSFKINKSLADKLQQNFKEHLAVAKSLTAGSSVEDYYKHYSYDKEFHELYIKGTGIPMLLELYNYTNPFTFVNYVYDLQSHERIVAGVLEHKDIIDALLSSDEELLRKSITKHIENSKSVINLLLRTTNIIQSQ